MSSGLLVVNAGSSSVKLAGYEIAEGMTRLPKPLMTVQAESRDRQLFVEACADGRMVFSVRIGGQTDTLDLVGEGLNALLGLAEERWPGLRWTTAGHRIVHGGPQYRAPVLLDPQVVKDLAQWIALAPLHQRANLHAVDVVAARCRDVRQVGCFDTAFHADLPAVETRFALPRAWHRAGVRRYGFHGLAYESVVLQLAEMRDDERVLLAHLGSGASLCALHGGRSVATSMGFTALDGLMMGTRCGSVDPGAVLHLLRQPGMDVDSVERLLTRDSGLRGVSGLSADMRELLDSSEPAAAEAIELFCHRAVREAGGLIALMGGIDRVVFSGGIGEHAAAVRSRICGQLGWLGLALAHSENLRDARVISTPASRVTVNVIPADEQALIAAHTALLTGMLTAEK